MPKVTAREDIYAAAERWRDTCLRSDGSMLSSGSLWTASNAAELMKEFVERPDEGNRTFDEKLQDQLGRASKGAIQLAAEMLWLMMLFPTNYLPATKRDMVARVWAWSDTPLDLANPALAPFRHGIGSGGPGYNNFRPYELQLLVRFVQAWKRMDVAERNRLLGDAWVFTEWFDTIEDAQSRQFRHMLLHLLFPNEFEPCSSAGDKRKIVKAFLPKISSGAQLSLKTTAIERDRRIGAIRRALEAEYPGQPIDFYGNAVVRNIWNPKVGPGVVSENEPSPFPRAKRVWLIGAGVDASLWEQFQSEGEITIGWDELGDLSQYKSLDAVRAAMQKVYDPTINPVNNALACDEFASVMQIGDEVYVKQGWQRVLAHGLITGEYEHDSTRAEHCNVRTVEWKKIHDWRLPKAFRLPTKTLTDISTYTHLLAYLRDALQPGAVATSAPKPYSADDIMQDAFLSRESVSAILDSLKRRKNIILQGPPGVGKSFLARKIAYALIGEVAEENVASVQFHQSYSYDDFMQGWRPGTNSFELKDGTFFQFCRNAQGIPGEKHVFIIDEINRGNLSKIFGELMFLIESDKRGPENALTLTYAGSPADTFFVPENVYIIGLMNTADRSLAMVDYALRRRFAFHDLRPALDSDAFSAHLTAKGVDGATLTRIKTNVSKVNEEILDDHKHLGPGFAIGHSYFCPTMRIDDSANWYERVVAEELLPLLTEYWFDNPKKVSRCADLLRA